MGGVWIVIFPIRFSRLNSGPFPSVLPLICGFWMLLCTDLYCGLRLELVFGQSTHTGLNADFLEMFLPCFSHLPLLIVSGPFSMNKAFFLRGE